MSGSQPPDPRARRVLAAAPRVHLAVATPSGPHISPTAVAVAGGRLWIVTPRGSLRVRMVRRRPQVGALLRDGRRSVVLRGTAEVLDPSSPAAGPGLLRLLAAAPAAARDYLPRNAGLLGGYLRDLLTLCGGALPLDRVLLTVRPEAGLLLDGDRVLARWGEWPPAIGLPAPAAEPTPPASPAGRPPEGVAALAGSDADAALGWSTAAGPLALPARWRAAGGRIQVPAALVDELALPRRTAACLSLDDSSSPRPSQLRGLILRGPAELRSRRGDRLDVHLRSERVSWFSGFRAGTTAAPAEGARRPA